MKYLTSTMINELPRSGESIYIVGAGVRGEFLGEYFLEKGIQLAGFIDISKKGSVKGKKIISYDEIDEKEAIFLISSFDSIQRGMELMLIKSGVNENSIVGFEDKEHFFQIFEEHENCSRYVKRIAELNNAYQGKRCFIIGNGPSLRIEDLERISKEYSFACNSIYALYESTTWRPTFYCAYDSLFYGDYLEKTNNCQYISENCDLMFISVLSNIFKRREIYGVDNIRFMKLSRRFEDELPSFSYDCSKEIFTAGTVAYVMIQMAVYMGFHEIFLLGIDCNYSVEEKKDGTIVYKDVCNHQKDIEAIDKKYEAEVIARHGHIANIDLHIAGYESAKKHAEAVGVKIRNATRGGELEVFDRVSFDSLM